MYRGCRAAGPWAFFPAAAAAAATRGGCGWCMVEVKEGGEVGQSISRSKALETRGDNTQAKEHLVHASAALNTWPGVGVKA